MKTESINKLLDTLTEKEQEQLYQFILALKQEEKRPALEADHQQTAGAVVPS